MFLYRTWLFKAKNAGEEKAETGRVSSISSRYVKTKWDGYADSHGGVFSSNGEPAATKSADSTAAASTENAIAGVANNGWTDANFATG